MKPNDRDCQMVTSRLAGELQPLLKDIMHGAKYIAVDPLSCIAISGTRNTSQFAVMRFVSILSGAVATTLEFGAGFIACACKTAILLRLEETDLLFRSIIF